MNDGKVNPASVESPPAVKTRLRWLQSLPLPVKVAGAGLLLYAVVTPLISLWTDSQQFAERPMLVTRTGDAEIVVEFALCDTRPIAGVLVKPAPQGSYARTFLVLTGESVSGEVVGLTVDRDSIESGLYAPDFATQVHVNAVVPPENITHFGQLSILEEAGDSVLRFADLDLAVGESALVTGRGPFDAPGATLLSRDAGVASLQGWCPSNG